MYTSRASYTIVITSRRVTLTRLKYSAQFTALSKSSCFHSATLTELQFRNTSAYVLALSSNESITTLWVLPRTRSRLCVQAKKLLPASTNSPRFEFSRENFPRLRTKQRCRGSLSLESLAAESDKRRGREERMDQSVRLLLGRIQSQLGAVLKDSVSLFLEAAAPALVVPSRGTFGYCVLG